MAPLRVAVLPRLRAPLPRHSNEQHSDGQPGELNDATRVETARSRDLTHPLTFGEPSKSGLLSFLRRRQRCTSDGEKGPSHGVSPRSGLFNLVAGGVEARVFLRH